MPKDVKLPENGKVVVVTEDQLSNGGDFGIEVSRPYHIRLGIRGVATMLMHRYNAEDVESKKNAAKNSKQKNEDNLEAYVYRDQEGHICIPGTYIYACLQDAGRYMQDPRSPRKSMRDLVKAGIIPVTEMAPITRDGEFFTDWDYVDQQRVKVTQSAITRSRPAFLSGWEAEWNLMITAPEYIPPEKVLKLATDAGRLCGIADYRPTYGRFAIAKFEVFDLED